ncbi:MAG TPA: hypothetical protein VFV87_04015 [Pirellulaceae bacterium]|nr:hypothetical protein [Pirellulaceae bacterium]
MDKQSVTAFFLALITILASIFWALPHIAPAQENVPIAPVTALARRLDIEFNETRLVDAVDYLQQQTGANFYLRARKLEEAGVNLDTPISSQFRAIRLDTWLDLALDDIDLTWMVKDDLIVITSPEDAERHLVTRVYDCRDLLALPRPTITIPERTTPDEAKAGQPTGDSSDKEKSAACQFCGSVRYVPKRPADPAEHLMEVITQAIDLHLWDENGGPGTIGEYSGMLVVTQTDRVHGKVERFLNMLREAAGLEVVGVKKVVR